MGILEGKAGNIHIRGGYHENIVVQDDRREVDISQGQTRQEGSWWRSDLQRRIYKCREADGKRQDIIRGVTAADAKGDRRE